MVFETLPIQGAFIADLQKRGDERGFFARQFCDREFSEIGLDFKMVQANTSFSSVKGTLRGMHYQVGTQAETKLVRCIRGAVWDCVLDLRRDSPTFGQWYGEVLSADNRKMMVVPKGCAHGFLSLTADSELFYMVDAFYAPDAEYGIRWDDPYFAIQWPSTPTLISERDSQHPHYQPQADIESSPIWHCRVGR